MGVSPMRRTGVSPVQPEAATRHFGPFPSGLAAQRYLDALADAFRLCRDVRCLRQAPNGRRCSYGQMNKCLCACDGTTSSADYRAVVVRAAEFVAGDRAATLDQFQREMKQAAGELQFERASLLKGRLARLAELEAQDYAFVAPAEEFRFLLVQRGEGRRKLNAFVAGAGAIRSAGTIDFPIKKEQIEKLAERANSRGEGREAGAAARMLPLEDSRKHGTPGAGSRGGNPSPDKWAMGLVAHYLFAAPRRRGLILSLRAGLAAEALEKEIAAFAKSLVMKRSAKTSDASSSESAGEPSGDASSGSPGDAPTSPGPV